jgi:hypothetical protein
MEDEEKSDIQVSLGDLMSSSICCVFVVPVIYFWGLFVGPHSFIIANLTY